MKRLLALLGRLGLMVIEALMHQPSPYPEACSFNLDELRYHTRVPSNLAP